MIIDNGKYYLYRHIRLDKNEPFYIGIAGKQADRGEFFYRAKRLTCRNRIWNSIFKTSNKQIAIEVLFESDNLDFIKEKEKEFIQLYGRKNNRTGILANMTDGGDGAVGSVATEESRRNQSLGQLNSTKTIKKGTKLPDWWVDKIRDKKKGELNPMFGKHTPISKKVINTETLEVFETILLAGKSFNLKGRLLHQYLDGSRVNKSPFVYLDTFNKLGKDGCLGLINQSPKFLKGNSKKVIDDLTGKEYVNAKIAANIFGYNPTYLRQVLSGNRKNKTNLRYA